MSTKSIGRMKADTCSSRGPDTSSIYSYSRPHAFRFLPGSERMIFRAVQITQSMMH